MRDRAHDDPASAKAVGGPLLGFRRKQFLATDRRLQPSSRWRKHFEVEKSTNVWKNFE